MVTVRSSINALIGCREPNLDKGPLHSTSADFRSIFMASANRDTEIVQPVMMPFSRRWQSDEVPEDTLRLVVVVVEEIADLLWDVVSAQGQFQLVWNRSISIAAVQPQYCQIAFAFLHLTDQLTHHISLASFVHM